MPKTTYRAAGGVVIDNGLMLLLDRPSRGEVRLPKGHIEAGEDAEIAALREVTEESGYADLSIVDSLGVALVEFDLDGRHVVREENYFLMALHSDFQVERGKKDTAQFFPIWKPLEEAINLLTFVAEQEAAQRAARLYSQAPDSPPPSVQ